ncbi:MAG: hypothetical protein V1798_03745 [Pseudomonadota bacterium]
MSRLTLFHVVLMGFVLVSGCGDGTSFSYRVLPAVPSPSNPPPSQPEEPPLCQTCTSSRVIELNPDIRSDKPNVKLVMIVDNSNSMTAHQTKLSLAMDGLLNGIRGYNVTVYLYSTTPYGSFLPWSGILLPGFQSDYVWSQKAVTQTDTLYTWLQSGSPMSSTSPPSGTQASAITQLKRNDTLSLVRSFAAGSGGSNPTFTESMSDTDFAVLKTQLKNRILDMGTSGSNSSESGSCNLVRALLETGQNKIFDPGDVAAFLILSDEDDFSSASTCVRSLVTGLKVENYTSLQPDNTCGNSCASYVYTVNSSPLPTVNALCSVVTYVDNVPRTWTYWTTLSENKSCSIAGSLGCTSSQLSQAQSGCMGTIVPSTCSYQCGCSAQSGLSCPTSDHVTLTIPNACTNSFTLNGVTYADVIDYLHRTGYGEKPYTSCSQQGYSNSSSTSWVSDSTVFSSVLLTEDPEAVRDDLIATFHKKAGALFGEHGYSIASIIQDPVKDLLQPDCKLSAEGGTLPGSYGLKYLDLMAGTAQPSQSFSICAPDYDGALSSLANFIGEVVESSFLLDFQAGESLGQVWIRRNGTDMKLTAGEDYTLNANRLDIKSGLLCAGDVLLAELVK